MFGARRSHDWFLDKARQLKEAAKRNPYQSQITYAIPASKAPNRSILAKSFKEYRIIQSIPGIGDKIAATILSKIGDINQFDHPKKLVAYAGLDSSVFEESLKHPSIVSRSEVHQDYDKRFTRPCNVV